MKPLRLLRRFGLTLATLLAAACSTLPTDAELRAARIEQAVVPMARAALAAGQVETARRLYTRLLDVAPDAAAARMGLGDVALASGRPARAAARYLDAAGLADAPSTRHAAWLAHGRASVAVGDLDAARASFGRIAAAGEDAAAELSAWAHNGLAVVAVLEGDPRAAVTAMERAVLLAPDERRLRKNLDRAVAVAAAYRGPAETAGGSVAGPAREPGDGALPMPSTPAASARVLASADGAAAAPAHPEADPSLATTATEDIADRSTQHTAANTLTATANAGNEATPGFAVVTPAPPPDGPDQYVSLPAAPHGRDEVAPTPAGDRDPGAAGKAPLSVANAAHALAPVPAQAPQGELETGAGPATNEAAAGMPAGANGVVPVVAAASPSPPLDTGDAAAPLSTPRAAEDRAARAQTGTAGAAELGGVGEEQVAVGDATRAPTFAAAPVPAPEQPPPEVREVEAEAAGEEAPPPRAVAGSEPAPMLASPASPADPPGAEPPPVGFVVRRDGGAYLQVGAFAVEANARRLAGRLPGFTDLPVGIEPPGDDGLHRVRIGPLAPSVDLPALRRALGAAPLG